MKISHSSRLFVLLALPDAGTETANSTTIDLISESLKSSDNRYLLILAENCEGTLEILKQRILRDQEIVVLFGSSFPKDQEYTQVLSQWNVIFKMSVTVQGFRGMVMNYDDDVS